MDCLFNGHCIWREFVHDPKKRDNVCPKPPPSTAGANASCTSRNVPLPPDNDQAGPSTAIPNPPAVEDHVSDDAYSEVQDSEVNDHVPGRRKRRRARSELILAYQCPACDRKYASSQALYQHRRNSHKQSPVAGGGGQSDVTDTVCDGEGRQGPSKRTRLVHPTSGDVGVLHSPGGLCVLSVTIYRAGAPHIRKFPKASTSNSPLQCHTSLFQGKIRDADIRKVAGELPVWQTVAKNLDFGRNIIDDIEIKHINNEDRCRAFLREWIHRDGSKATYEKLCEVLEKLEEPGAVEIIKNIAGKKKFNAVV
ncbi:hypothetical protein EMCRGX_G015971 [Ephydatia muelleri]